MILPHHTRRKTVGTFGAKVHCFFRKVGDFRGKRGDCEKALIEEKRRWRDAFFDLRQVCTKSHTPAWTNIHGVCTTDSIYIIEQRRSDTEAVVQPLKKEPSPLGGARGIKKTKTTKNENDRFSTRSWALCGKADNAGARSRGGEGRKAEGRGKNRGHAAAGHRKNERNARRLARKT